MKSIEQKSTQLSFVFFVNKQTNINNNNTENTKTYSMSRLPLTKFCRYIVFIVYINIYIYTIIHIHSVRVCVLLFQKNIYIYIYLNKLLIFPMKNPLSLSHIECVCAYIYVWSVVGLGLCMYNRI